MRFKARWFALSLHYISCRRLHPGIRRLFPFYSFGIIHTLTAWQMLLSQWHLWEWKWMSSNRQLAQLQRCGEYRSRCRLIFFLSHIPVNISCIWMRLPPYPYCSIEAKNIETVFRRKRRTQWKIIHQHKCIKIYYGTNIWRETPARLVLARCAAVFIRFLFYIVRRSPYSIFPSDNIFFWMAFRASP